MTKISESSAVPGWRQAMSRGLEYLTTPLLPEDFLDYVAPLRPGAQLRGRVVSVTRETEDVWTIVVRPGADWRGHIPGQYVRVGVDIDGVRHFRNYSLTSHRARPGRHTILSFSVRAIPGGLVSGHLTTALRPGDVLWLTQADGDFVLPEPVPRNVLLIAGGVGVTPILGMLRGADLTGSQVTVIHATRRRCDAVAADELAGLARRGVITLHTWLSSEAGRITCDDIKRLVPDWDDHQTWVCGPGEMITMCEEFWAAHDVTDRLHSERFRPVTITGGTGGDVTFSESAQTVSSGPDTPLLVTGEDAGVQMPSGCRMGVCFGCVVNLQEGSVRDLRTGETTDATGESDVAIQTCITAANGPCTLRI